MAAYPFSEAELREYFIDSIANRRDIDVFVEIPVFSRSVDLVLHDRVSKKIVAIEFKLHDWKRAIYQVENVGLCFDALFICVPKPKTTTVLEKIKESCASYGVGLLLYDITLRKFTRELEAQPSSEVWKKERDRIVNYLEALQYETSIETSKI